MVLLIDGPDGTGKSTVCDILSDRMKMPIVKMPNMVQYFTENNPEEFSKLFNETIVQFKDSDFILDRGFTSSLVYSKVYDRQFNLSYLENLEKTLDAEVYILTVDDEQMMERRPVDEIITKEFRSQVRDEFENLAANRQYKLIDTSHISAEDVATEIMSHSYGEN